MSTVDDIWSIYEQVKISDNEEKNKMITDRNIANFRTCKGCSQLLSEQHVSDGFLVCTNCGLVKESFIDMNAEWRCFNNVNGGKDTSSIRCGDAASTLLPGTQLNTFIGGKDRRLQRIHQWNNMSSKERNLFQIHKEFEALGAIHNLSKNTVACASELYNKLHIEMEKRNHGVKRCNVRQGLKAACIYHACKKNNDPREKKEIAEMLGNTTKTVTTGCHSFLDIMGEEYIKLEPFTALDFVTRFSQKLSISYKYEVILKQIIEYLSTLNILTESTPTNIASASIFFLSQIYSLGITKEEIHKQCGSSKIIIGKMYNKINAYKHEIMNSINSIREK